MTDERDHAPRTRIASEVLSRGNASRGRLSGESELGLERERRLERQANAAEDLLDREQRRRHEAERHEADMGFIRQRDAAYLRRYNDETTHLARASLLKNLAKVVALGSSIWTLLHLPALVHWIAANL